MVDILVDLEESLWEAFVKSLGRLVQLSIWQRHQGRKIGDGEQLYLPVS
jgi:hypothetical protein